jgi:uncharacterized RDD family membrane protein YckC
MICPKCGTANGVLAISCSHCEHTLRAFKPIIEGIFPSENIVILASIKQRVLATITDLLLINFAFGGVAAVFVFLTKVPAEPIQSISFLLLWLYNAGMESSARQATVGKLLFRIAVTDISGHKISFGKATLRYFLKLITIFGLLSIIRAITDEKKQALHDTWSGTIVLQKPKISG